MQKIQIVDNFFILSGFEVESSQKRHVVTAFDCKNNVPLE